MRNFLKIIFLILFLLLPLTNSFGIWTNVNSYYSIGTQDVISLNNILFATCGKTIIKSTNNGSTWSIAYNDLINSGNFSTGQLTSHVNKLFAIRWGNLNYNKLLSSSDFGQTWVEVSTFPFINANILFSSGSKLFVGTSQNGIYTSTNEGVNWTTALPPIIDVVVNGFTVLNSDIYCATSKGTYKSTNSGSNWFQSGLSDNACYAITACNQNLIVSADSSTNKKICVSTNYGLTWSGYPFQISGMYSITSIGNTAYMASISSIYKSTNGGFNWITLPIISETINWVGSVGQRLYVGNGRSNVSYSDNEGLNWETKYVNMNKSNSLVQLNNNIFAGTSNGVFISPSASQSWTQTSLNHTEVFCVAVSDSRIFAGTKDYGIYYSDNNGSNWTQSSLNNKSVLSFVTANNKIFAGTISSGIYVSTDNGINWAQSSLNNQSVNCVLSANSNLFCGTENNGIFISTNSGSSWTQTSCNNRTVYTLHYDGTRLYAGTLNYGFYVSIDSGKGWNSFGFQGKTVRSFANWGYSTFCVVDNDGFYFSSNWGLSWTLKNNGLNGEFYPSGMIVTNNSMVYISTFKTSVWQNTANSVSIQQVGSVSLEKFILFQNYPNPFNPNTKIKFDIAKSSLLQMKIYNSAGKEIETILNERLSAGTYEVNWNAANLPSGIYYCKLTSENFSDTKKMILIK